MTLKFSWPGLRTEKGARDSWIGRQKQTQRKRMTKSEVKQPDRRQELERGGDVERPKPAC